MVIIKSNSFKLGQNNDKIMRTSVNLPSRIPVNTLLFQHPIPKYHLLLYISVKVTINLHIRYKIYRIKL